MMCFRPITLTDGDGKPYNVPCGKCAACLHNLTYEWYVRLLCEFYNARNAFFITLTYNDESLPYHCVDRGCFDANLHLLRSDPRLSKKDLDIFIRACVFKDSKVKFPVYSKTDLQKFLKRLRYNLGLDGLKYFGISEYCPTSLRPHYHLIIFNALPSGSSFDTFVKCIERSWSKGFVDVKTLNDNRIFYTVKYCFGSIFLPSWPYSLPGVKPRRFMSKGLGLSYLTDEIIRWHKEDLKTYYQDGRRKLKLPRYLRDKIFNDEELLQIQERTQLFLLDHNHNYRKKLSELRIMDSVKGVSSLQEQEDMLNKKISDKYRKRH